MAPLIGTHCSDGVLTVRLNRPEVHNAFNPQVIAEVTEAFEQAGTDASIRVVVLAAAGKSFCAGADLNWMRQMVDYTFEENVADARGLSGMLRAVDQCPRPVIGRVQGAAFGGGIGLVAACDLVAALESATFCLSEARLGMAPATIAPMILAKMGASACRRYALTADRFSAAEARRIGLVHEVAATETDLDSRVEQWAAAIKQCGPEALAATKQIFREAAALGEAESFERMSEHIARLRASPEGQEGIRAFLEKREAGWR